MKQREDGSYIFEGAFPFVLPDASKAQEYDPGMTLRDYFAAKALQGMLSRETETTAVNQLIDATWAYEYADAMLKAREVKS